MIGFIFGLVLGILGGGFTVALMIGATNLMREEDNGRHDN
jgi:hypothetical protein